jgi:hypothetical protein
LCKGVKFFFKEKMDIFGEIKSFLPPDSRNQSTTGNIKRENLNDPPPQKPMETTVSLQATIASTRLLEQTGQVKIPKRIYAETEQEQIERQLTKEEKQNAKKRKERELAKQVPKVKAAVMPVEQRQEKVILPTEMPEEMSIQNLEQHNHRASKVSLFSSSVECPTKPSTAYVINTPSMVDTLKMARKVKSLGLVVDQYMEMLANNPELKLQNMPVYTRSTLNPFLYAPDPKQSWQRPCCNLNRQPVQGEEIIQCAGYQLSASLLGTDKAFKPRELLFPYQIVQINHTLEVEREDPSKHLLPVPQMCYMCHLYLTNQMFLEQRHKLEDREREDHTQARSKRTTLITILNRFIVTFGTEGEYDVKRLIASDSISLGILGPFPLWSPRHYRTTMDHTGLPGFVEKDILVFRLSQEPSQLIESDTPNDSTRSTPTSVRRGAMTSRQ